MSFTLPSDFSSESLGIDENIEKEEKKIEEEIDEEEEEEEEKMQDLENEFDEEFKNMEEEEEEKSEKKRKYEFDDESTEPTKRVKLSFITALDDAEEENEFDEDSPRTQNRKKEIAGEIRMRKTQKILSQLTPTQNKRYENYKRSRFLKSKMKSIMSQYIPGVTINESMGVVMCGISKLFVGDLVEYSKIIMRENNEEGAIQPHHIREAYRRLDVEGKIPHLQRKKKLLM
jgi:transcription initiation factor TFIID subunit 11